MVRTRLFPAKIGPKSLGIATCQNGPSAGKMVDSRSNPEPCLERVRASKAARREEPDVSVVIRMKMMGKAHRAFFRICATDMRAPRDGRVLEEIGTYDPSVPETDARVKFNNERV